MKRAIYESLRWQHKITQTGADVSYEWDSYENFLKDLETLKRNDRAFYNQCRHSTGLESWYGTADGFDGVLHRTSNGWPELREAMLKKLDGLELEMPVFPSQTHVRRRKRRRGDQGDVVDMNRVWSGDLEHAWERPVKVEKLAVNTRRVTLAFDVTANASKTNEMAMWRGALCMLLVNSLARAGRTFEIYVVDSTSNPFTAYDSSAPRYLWSSWMVKSSSEPVVPDRLAAMVSIGFMRTVGFSAEGMGPWEVSHSFGGALNRDLPHSLRKRQENGEVVLRVGECYSKQDVLREYAEAWKRIEQAADEAA